MWLKDIIIQRLKRIANGFDRESYNSPAGYYIITPDLPDEWISIGLVPKPKTQLGWFVYHMVHGLMMRYPFHRVLAFSILWLITPDDGW